MRYQFFCEEMMPHRLFCSRRFERALWPHLFVDLKAFEEVATTSASNINEYRKYFLGVKAAFA
jgi:hypothetical protein